MLMAIALLLVAGWQWRSGQRVIAVIAAAIALLAVLWFFDTKRVPDELVGTTPVRGDHPGAGTGLATVADAQGGRPGLPPG